MMLQGKRAIVTGSARGIGAAIAARFAQDGASVLMCDILADRLNESADQLRSAGGKGHVAALAGDLTDSRFCDRVIETALRELGGVDVLVNNAGIARWSPVVDHSEEDWDDTLAVNLKAVFLLSQRAAREMIRQKTGGSILSMASNNAHVAEPGVAAYNAAKAGIVLLTKTMAVELAEHNIRANCVSPGHIGPTELALEGGADDKFFDELTEGIPLGRLGKLEEVAALYAFLASDDAGFVNGESVVIDGGQTAGQAGQ